MQIVMFGSIILNLSNSFVRFSFRPDPNHANLYLKFHFQDKKNYKKTLQNSKLSLITTVEKWNFVLKVATCSAL